MLWEYPVKSDSREELVYYICFLHNKVNEKLNKPIFDCKKAFEFWGGDCGCSLANNNSGKASNSTNVDNATNSNSFSSNSTQLTNSLHHNSQTNTTNVEHLISNNSLLSTSEHSFTNGTHHGQGNVTHRHFRN